MSSFRMPAFWLVLMMALTGTASAQTIFVYPTNQSANIAEDVRFFINISSITDLYGFDFFLNYDSSKLRLESYQEGSFLGNLFCGNTSNLGEIRLYCTRTGEGSGVSGSGDLAVFNFIAESDSGTSILDINSVMVSDSNVQPIDVSVNDGSVTFMACQDGETRECGTTGVGECSYGTRTCTNGQWGDCIGEVTPVAEICDRKDNNCDGIIDNVYGGNSVSSTKCQCYGGNTPGTEICNNIDDDCDSSIDESLSRQCRDSRYGNCAVGTESCSSGIWVGCPAKVADETIEPYCNNGENDDCDAEETDRPCGGDVNTDNCVDIFDLVLIGNNFGKTGTSAELNVENIIDLNYDGEINIFDLVLVGRDYGSGYYGTVC